MKQETLDSIELTPDIVIGEDFMTAVWHGENWAFSEIQAFTLALMINQYRDCRKRIWSNTEIVRKVYPGGWADKSVRRIMRINRDGKRVAHPCWGKLIGKGPARNTIELFVNQGREIPPEVSP